MRWLLLTFFLTGQLYAATYYVSPNGSDNNSGSQAQPWKTLQKAARVLKAGDVVLIAPGVYSGPVTHTRSGRSGSPITYRASGQGVILRGSGSERDALYINEADYVVIDGLRIENATRAGIRISLSDFVTIRNTICANNGKWGIFTDYSNRLLIERNRCFGSVEEHGIYVSNSGDYPVIRDNIVYDNNASGIQINADPALPGDGITTGAIVERNIVYNNGRAGGAAINLASVRNSIIRNNLLYRNKAGGIAGWGDGNGPAWGCKNNRIANNTIFFLNGQGRWCIALKEGSTGNRILNNILRGGARGCFEMDNNSAPLQMDYNLFFREDSGLIATNEDTAEFFTLSQWRQRGFDRNSRYANPRFENPAAANFLLRTSSPARNRGINLPYVKTDLRKVIRPQGSGADIGCYEQ